MACALLVLLSRIDLQKKSVHGLPNKLLLSPQEICQIFDLLHLNLLVYRHIDIKISELHYQDLDYTSKDSNYRHNNQVLEKKRYQVNLLSFLQLLIFLERLNHRTAKANH